MQEHHDVFLSFHCIDKGIFLIIITLSFRMNCQKLYKKWSISPSSSLYFKWRAVVFLTSILFVVGHTSVASFKVSFNDIGYGDSTFLISIFAMCYFYDLILALDVLLVLRTEIDDSQKGSYFLCLHVPLKVILKHSRTIVVNLFFVFNVFFVSC